MHIIVRENSEHPFEISIPNRLVLNHLSAALLSPQLKKHQIPWNQRQLYHLMKVIQQYQKYYPEWVLLEAESADGEYVEIRL